MVFGSLATNGRVFGFETSSHNVTVGRRNIETNNIQNVELFFNALSDSSVPIAVMNNSGGVAPSGFEGSSQIIDSITIDEFCAKKGLTPTLVKIDVEGHELEVLRGMKGVLQHVPKIMLELSNFAFTDVDKYVHEIFSLLPIREYTGSYQVDAGTEMVEFDFLTETDMKLLAQFANPHVYLLPRTPASG